ncbi:MAG: IS110 family transposase [Pseudonocardia sp.]|nr:IS110 family transposase [Pseudonocardia sp.]
MGPILAAVFVAEIGDITRFTEPQQLTSWAGPTPKHHQSDTTVHRGRITKQGSRLMRSLGRGRGRAARARAHPPRAAPRPGRRTPRPQHRGGSRRPGPDHAGVLRATGSPPALPAPQGGGVSLPDLVVDADRGSHDPRAGTACQLGVIVPFD